MQKKEIPLIHSEKDYVMEEKLDRLENHFKVYKTDMIDLKTTVKNVETALIGSPLNGNKGIVNLIDEVNKKVEDMEKKQLLHEDTIKNYKSTLKLVIGGFISYIIWLFTKTR